MAEPTFNIFADKAASAATATDRDGQTASAAIRMTLLAGGARFAVPLRDMNLALDTFGQRFGTLATQYRPDALKSEAGKLAVATVGPAWRGMRGAIVAAKREDAARTVEATATPPNLPLADMDRARFLALDTAGRADFIERASRDELAALVVAGQSRFAGTPDGLWTRLIERYVIVSHIAKTGLQSDFALRSSPSDPAASGPDIAAAERAAGGAVKRWRQDQTEIVDVEQILRSVIAVMAVATDRSVDEAFSLLDGEAA